MIRMIVRECKIEKNICGVFEDTKIAEIDKDSSQMIINTIIKRYRYLFDILEKVFKPSDPEKIVIDIKSLMKDLEESIVPIVEKQLHKVFQFSEYKDSNITIIRKSIISPAFHNIIIIMFNDLLEKTMDACRGSFNKIFSMYKEYNLLHDLKNSKEKYVECGSHTDEENYPHISIFIDKNQPKIMFKINDDELRAALRGKELVSFVLRIENNSTNAKYDYTEKINMVIQLNTQPLSDYFQVVAKKFY